VTSTVSPSITILAGFFTFLLMTSLDYELHTSEAFTILSIYTALQFSVATLPMAIKFITEAHVGLGRLQKVLQLKEYRHPTEGQMTRTASMKSSEVISIESGNFAWESTPPGKKASKDKKKNGKNEKQKQLKSQIEENWNYGAA
jgi:hypothetical protein